MKMLVQESKKQKDCFVEKFLPISYMHCRQLQVISKQLFI
jgi:hypothetical protein